MVPAIATENQEAEAIVSPTLNWMKQMKTTRGVIAEGNLERGFKFCVRSLDPDRDLPIIHQWVNMDYARTFWQMDGTFEMLEEAYEKLLGLKHVHSLVGLADDVIVCQMDVYLPEFDVVGEFYGVQRGDVGVHLLLGSEKTKVANFSAKVVSFFCGLFFEWDAVRRIVAEPDHQNKAANWLLRRLNFEQHGLLELPEKKANFYSLTKG